MDKHKLMEFIRPTYLLKHTSIFTLSSVERVSPEDGGNTATETVAENYDTVELSGYWPTCY